MGTLLELRQGDTGIIVKIRGRGAFRRRLAEMGFIKGRPIRVIKAAPLQDPIEYKIMDYNVSLRRNESALIEVVRPDEVTTEAPPGAGPNVLITDEIVRKAISRKGKTIELALVGNPNCGKTTIFNFASRSREHVGNYGGITVDSKEAQFRHHGYDFNITDLPGTYSLSAYTPEEIFVRRHLLRNPPDVIINVIDASNLERNLYLTSQLIDMDLKVVVALNMFDELQSRGDKLDYDMLGKLTGIPFVPTIGSRGVGLKELFEKVIDVFEDKDPTLRHIHIHHGDEIEKSILRIQDKIWQDKSITDTVSSRYFAIKLLEKDRDIKVELGDSKYTQEIVDTAWGEIGRLEDVFKEETQQLITGVKYGFIAGALRETLEPNLQSRKMRNETEVVDTLLTHKILGFPIFIAFLWIMFQSTFTFGEYPQQGIEWLFALAGNLVSRWMDSGPLKDLLVDGIIKGVGSVIVFLPNILILFFFISIMEDTGYMARAAFIMDRLMHRIGLHGKSFIPLIMGFGCNVPAIMATRTLRNKNERLLTMLILPFMSCSARLPVYILVAGALFPQQAGNIIFLIYLTGILLAVLTSLLFKRFLFREKEAPFVMELPPYRLPTMKSTVLHMWEKGVQYLKKMGGIILIAVIIIWALGYFPLQQEAMNKWDQRITATTKEYDHRIANLPPTSPGKDKLVAEKENDLNILAHEMHQEKLSNSYIGHVGRFIEPVITPLGFDWRMGISLVTGAAAKEIIVSTMGVLFNPTDGDYQNTLEQTIRQAEFTSGSKKGQPLFTPLASIAFLVFILIYFPCVAVIAAVKRESDSWKWALFLVAYTTLLAWLLAMLVFQIGSLFNNPS